MNNATLSKINRMLLCLLIAGFAVVLWLAGERFYGFKIEDFSDPVKIIEDWQVTVDGVKQARLSVPEVYTVSDCVLLSYRLDDCSIKQGGINVLRYHTCYNNIEVIIEGEKIYSYPGTEDSRLFGMYTPEADHYIPIRPDDYGKTMTLRMTPAGGHHMVEVRGGMLTTKSQAVLEAICKDVWRICIDIVIMVMGTMLVATYLVMRRHAQHPAIFWLGMFLVCYSIWDNAFTDTLLMLSSNKYLHYIISYNMFSILGVLWLFFAFHLNKMRRPKLFNGLIFSLLIVAVITFLLHVFSVVDYHESFWMMDISVVGAAAAGISVLLIDFFKKRDMGHYAFLGTVGIMVFVFLDVAKFFISGRQRNGIILDVGMLFFTVCYIIELVLRAIDALVLQSRMHALELAAYQDQLTGSGNRRAFDQKLATYSKGKSGETADITHMAMVMFDSNNLKIINDTYGHACGDRLIIDTAEALRCYLGGFGTVYRIGGDEFVVVCDGADRIKLNLALETFEREANSNGDRNIDVSWGVAYYEAEIDSDPNSVLMRAEHRMYEYKKGCKL